VATPPATPAPIALHSQPHLLLQSCIADSSQPRIEVVRFDLRHLPQRLLCLFPYCKGTSVPMVAWAFIR